MRLRTTITGFLTLVLVSMSYMSSACAASCDLRVLHLGCSRHMAVHASAQTTTAEAMPEDCHGMAVDENSSTPTNGSAIVTGGACCLHSVCNHDESATITDATVHFEQVCAAPQAFQVIVDRPDLQVSRSLAYRSPPSSPPSLISVFRI